MFERFTARIWDADSGKETAQLKGHTRGVPSADFSPDDKRVLTAPLDRTVRIWDVTWATLVRGDALRERVCAEKMVGPAQEFRWRARRPDPARHRQERSDRAQSLPAAGSALAGLLDAAAG